MNGRHRSMYPPKSYVVPVAAPVVSDEEGTGVERREAIQGTACALPVPMLQRPAAGITSVQGLYT